MEALAVSVQTRAGHPGHLTTDFCRIFHHAQGIRGIYGGILPQPRRRGAAPLCGAGCGVQGIRGIYGGILPILCKQVPTHTHPQAGREARQKGVVGDAAPAVHLVMQKLRKKVLLATRPSVANGRNGLSPPCQ